MKGHSLKMAGAAILVLGLFVDSSWAEKTGKAAPLKMGLRSLRGTVEVTRDKAGQITAVELKVGTVLRTTYKITLDAKGRDLGGKMAKKQVLVKGTVEKRSGVKWLTVRTYMESASKPVKKTTRG